MDKILACGLSLKKKSVWLPFLKEFWQWMSQVLDILLHLSMKHYAHGNSLI
jgi:hypothetical protein